MTNKLIEESLSRATPRIMTKIFYVLLFLAFATFLIYANSVRKYNSEMEGKLIQDVLEVAAADPDYVKKYERKNAVSDLNEAKFLADDGATGLKQILLWTSTDTIPFGYFGIGRGKFITNNCEFTNCNVTAYTSDFKGNITDYDAIAFNGRNMRYFSTGDLPQQRSPHQKYIFVNWESSSYEPVCNDWFDNFFNWTCTYKLDSDIVYSYIYIRDKSGVPVGPKIDMNWIKDMKEIDDEIKERLKSKKKAAAWFVSHCVTRSKREKHVKSLQKALESYGLEIDVYGKCGPLVCEQNAVQCRLMMTKDYYFYLSFENAFTEDYVTEKLLTALTYDAVPIVYGGANYSRFLPPGSYLDARAHDPTSLAAIMADVISNRTKYHDFFRWRQHYTYSDAVAKEDVCNVCAALNDRNKMAPSLRKEFRSWWNPDWEERCKDEYWSTNWSVMHCLNGIINGK